MFLKRAFKSSLKFFLRVNYSALSRRQNTKIPKTTAISTHYYAIFKETPLFKCLVCSILSLAILLQQNNSKKNTTHAKSKYDENEGDEVDMDATIQLDLNEIYEKCAVIFLSNKEVLR